MAITATVVQTVSVRSAHQAATLNISAEDVERGYVTVRAGSRIQITHAGPCLFEFRGTAPVFSSVSVSAAGVAKEFGFEGGTVYRAPATRSPAEISFDYRFGLASGVRPGTHPWPVALTILPM